MGALNDVDLAAAEKSVALYRDAWRVPLRPDEVVDFEDRRGMYEACETWETPFVRVRKVDKKEAAARVASDAGSEDSPSPSASESSSERSPSEDAPLSDDVLGMCFVVGRVLSVKKHPEAEKMYVEEIDCGDPEGPRTVCSGLARFVKASDLEGKLVVVVSNLKPRNMAGIVSAGMVLCANNGRDGEARAVELLVAPEDAKPGERLGWGPERKYVEPHGANKVAKKKIWENTQPDLIVNQSCEATWRGVVLTSSAGAVTCASLRGGGIS